MDTITCPWCEQRNYESALECHKCGGPLPAPVGEDPGLPPPLPPRQLPKGYKQRMLITNVPTNLIGAIFLLVGLPIALIFPIVGAATSQWLFLVLGCGLGGLFTVLGGGLLVFGIRHGISKIRPYELGQAVIGEVTDIYRDTSIIVNGRNPWQIVYEFDAGGLPYEGKALTWKNAPRTQAVGNRIFVLYMVDDPSQNVLYPPV